jgi:gliding motility-associated lipoprotein GldH
MRFAVMLIVVAVAIMGCDSNRIFEDNVDFPKRTWSLGDTVAFEFSITDPNVSYNVQCDIRNSLDYPFSRIFVNYVLEDSTHKVVSTKLVQYYLFDAKTGAPTGNSGVGDIYDHRFPLLENQKFAPGKYFVKLQQYMRSDTLAGVLAAGVRVETVGK